MISLAEAPSLFPHRQTCVWTEQMSGLSARVCEDGTITMWRDEDRNVWLPGERAPRRWRKFFKHTSLGAAVSPLPGICTPHHAPVPLTKIRRLQNALRGLSTRVSDASLRVVADGLIGAHTVAAANRAMITYVGSPAELATGRLTHAQVAAFAPQLTSYIEKAPHAAAAPSSYSPPPPPSLPPQPAAQPSGAPTMPYNDDPGYYPPQQAIYYPPPAYGPGPNYGPHRAPGGLPADRASVDVKAFVPAQYEHIRVEPGTVMLLVAGGVIAYLLINNKKKKEA